MAPKGNNTKTGRETLIARYMSYVLENEGSPKSIYKFCKENNFREQDFYEHFGSIDGLKGAIWNTFFDSTQKLLEKNADFNSFSNKDKLLTFYFSFFELLAMNRSYVLFALQEDSRPLKNLEQLRGLRNRFRNFTGELIEAGNSGKTFKINRRNPALFSEGAWLQFMFLIRFWLNDSSPAFEKTDLAIEKSVQTAFDLFENTPLDSILDFGKFLYKERMG